MEIFLTISAVLFFQLGLCFFCFIKKSAKAVVG